MQENMIRFCFKYSTLPQKYDIAHCVWETSRTCLDHLYWGSTRNAIALGSPLYFFRGWGAWSAGVLVNEELVVTSKGDNLRPSTTWHLHFQDGSWSFLRIQDYVWSTTWHNDTTGSVETGKWENLQNGKKIHQPYEHEVNLDHNLSNSIVQLSNTYSGFLLGWIYELCRWSCDTSKNPLICDALFFTTNDPSVFHGIAGPCSCWKKSPSIRFQTSFVFLQISSVWVDQTT